LDDQQLVPIRLDDAVRTALANAAIVLDRDDFLSPANGLLANPGAVPSAYDVQLQQTSGQGVEAALAAFDSQLAAGAQWGHNALVQGNSFLTGSVARSDLLATGSGSFFARLDKPLAGGGVASLIPNWNYALNNLPSQSFNSQFAGFLRGEFRQPLLAGRGRQFTDVAGPLNYRGGSRRGLAIARIDEDVSIVEFDARVQRLLRQTEDLYWDLWLAYETYHSRAAARDSAYQLWQRVRGRAVAGLNGGEAADEAEAQENYHDRRNRAAAALADVLEAEARLRRLVGMPAGGGQVLAPADKPRLAPYRIDWDSALAGALASRSELRKQELWIRSLELQLIAAKSLALPQLDLVTGVQVNGLDDQLFGSGTGPTSGGVQRLLDPEHLGWNAGLEFSMPLGFRQERARVRHYELQLAKARAAHAAQQSEIGHELAHALRELERWQASVEATSDRRQAAVRRLKAVEADYQAGRTPLDRLLRSQVALSEAEIAHVHSIAQYNKSLSEFFYRKGELLVQSDILLTDAQERS
jgi:outer membrane protein TolC